MEINYTVDDIETESKANQLAEYKVHLEIYPGYILKISPRPVLLGKDINDIYMYAIHADIDLTTPVGPVKFVMQCSQETFDELTNMARASGSVLRLFDLLKSAIPGFGIRPVMKRYPSKGA
jgi:hypothetical protein